MTNRKLWKIVVDILLVPVVLESIVVKKVESSHGNGSELKSKVFGLLLLQETFPIFLLLQETFPTFLLLQETFPIFQTEIHPN